MEATPRADESEPLVGPKEPKEPKDQPTARSVVPLLSLIFVVLAGGLALWTQRPLRHDMARGMKEVERYAGEAEKETSHLFLQLKPQQRPSPSPSIFCWALIQANSSEEQLMRQHRQSNSGIFGCDDWLLLSDFPVHYGDVRSAAIGAFNSKRAPWNSWYNVPVFLRAWKKLIEDQRCLSYAWTVKVDMDTFLCQNRLRQRLRNASVPANESTFWLNYDAASNPGPLDFLGPLEIFSRAAIQSYQKKGAEVCPRPHPQTQGEDAFMKDCMMKLQALPRKDYSLLKNACDWCAPLNAEQCSSSDHVAFHPFKSPELFANCSKRAEHATIAC